MRSVILILLFFGLSTAQDLEQCTPTMTGLKWLEIPIRYKLIDPPLREAMYEATRRWTGPGLRFTGTP